MTPYIDEERGRFGVEPICRVLEWNVSTYYEFRRRPPSLRQLEDESLIGLIYDVYQQNRQLYGARKVWRQLRRDGIQVGRSTVERLLRQEGIRGVRRGKGRKTTRPDLTAPRPADLVDRNFVASRPNQVWVADLTYLRIFSSFVYAFRAGGTSRLISAAPSSSLTLMTLLRRVHGPVFHGDSVP